MVRVCFFLVSVDFLLFGFGFGFGGFICCYEYCDCVGDDFRYVGVVDVDRYIEEV